MLFTRACMSSARCAKLVMMMGLHRLDDETDTSARPMAPMLSPPRDWVELEERRRALWGAFCIDSHASISTGYPNLLDVTEITTHLPSSEEAFNSGVPDPDAPSLHNVFSIGNYSTFAGAVIVCHLFNQILRHVHRPTPLDRPDDVEGGRFWTRHRELDSTLSNAFMFLPERFRLPKNVRNPIAVHTNLNLHASIICLHNAACEKADKHALPPSLKKASLDRLITAAQEIVNIMKLTAHLNTGLKSPLAALSLYCAVSVYIYQAKASSSSSSPSPPSPTQTETNNIEFLMNCMAAIGQEHFITRAFLHQAIQDIKLNGLSVSFSPTKWENLPYSIPSGVGVATHSIPLLARSSITKDSGPPAPLPRGGEPYQNSSTCLLVAGEGERFYQPGRVVEDDEVGGSGSGKRRRTSPPPTTGGGYATGRDRLPPVGVGLSVLAGNGHASETGKWPLKPPPAGAPTPWTTFATRMKLAHHGPGPSLASESPSPASSGAAEREEVSRLMDMEGILGQGQEPVWDMETGELLVDDGLAREFLRCGQSFGGLQQEVDPWMGD